MDYKVCDIFFVVAGTMGVALWMLCEQNQKVLNELDWKKKGDTTNVTSYPYSQEPEIVEFSIASEKEKEDTFLETIQIQSGSVVKFRMKIKNADFCTLSGGELFDPEMRISLNGEDIKKQTNDFSGGWYILRCEKASSGKVVAKKVHLEVVPLRKVVMCYKQCGSRGIQVEKEMTRFLGETVQNVRACFGNFLETCPKEDVTERAEWTSSNLDVSYWTRDLQYPGETFKNVYPVKTFLVSGVGDARMSVEYQRYTFSLLVKGEAL